MCIRDRSDSWAGGTVDSPDVVGIVVRNLLVCVRGTPQCCGGPPLGRRAMRQSLGAIIAVSLLGAGCASLQETKMYNGPFGRTEVGAVMIAADPASSKVLVETYDGDLWIYDVEASARARLSGLRVGDEVVLAFDDRIAGKRAIAINVLAAGSRPLPPGMLSVADLL